MANNEFSSNNGMGNSAQSGRETDVRDMMNRGMESLRGGIDTASSGVTDFVRQRPYVAVGAALGAGFLVAKLLSSRE